MTIDGPHQRTTAWTAPGAAGIILASRVAIACSGIVLGALLVGAIPFGPGAMAGAVAAFLGGIVVWGSNGSTANEARTSWLRPRQIGQR